MGHVALIVLVLLTVFVLVSFVAFVAMVCVFRLAHRINRAQEPYEQDWLS